MKTISQLHEMFVQINVDCAKTGESVVPFTDTEYYAEQLVNLDVYPTLSQAKRAADAMLVIDQESK